MNAVLADLRHALDVNFARVLDLFRKWDVDGDGTIRKAELGKALEALGYEAQPAAVQELFDEFDRNGNGSVDYKELFRAIKHRPERGSGGGGGSCAAAAAAPRRAPRVALARECLCGDATRAQAAPLSLRVVSMPTADEWDGGGATASAPTVGKYGGGGFDAAIAKAGGGGGGGGDRFESVLRHRSTRSVSVAL